MDSDKKINYGYLMKLVPLVLILTIFLISCEKNTNGNAKSFSSDNITKEINFSNLITYSSTELCPQDTDGGMNIFQKGTLTVTKKGVTQIFEDICIDGNNLQENYCITLDAMQTGLVPCPGQCKSGQCVPFYNEDKCTVIEQNTDENKAINVVFVLTGYTQREVVFNYIQDSFLPFFFSHEPYQSNRNKFNFYYVNNTFSNEQFYGNISGDFPPYSEAYPWLLIGDCIRPERKNVVMVVLSEPIHGIQGYWHDFASFPNVNSMIISRVNLVVDHVHLELNLTNVMENHNRNLMHELGGHAIGNLVDEYDPHNSMTLNTGHLPVPRYSNCYAGNKESCEKYASWSDLINLGCGRYGLEHCELNDDRRIGCFEGCGLDIQKFRPRLNSSIMLESDLPGTFGLANERLICCSMLKITGSVSGSCNIFNDLLLPRNLVDFCQEVWNQ